VLRHRQDRKIFGPLAARVEGPARRLCYVVAVASGPLHPPARSSPAEELGHRKCDEHRSVEDGAAITRKSASPSYPDSQGPRRHDSSRPRALGVQDDRLGRTGRRVDVPSAAGSFTAHICSLPSRSRVGAAGYLRHASLRCYPDGPRFDRRASSRNRIRASLATSFKARPVAAQYLLSRTARSPGSRRPTWAYSVMVGSAPACGFRLATVAFLGTVAPLRRALARRPDRRLWREASRAPSEPLDA
jgi:hypothetical protein